MGHRSPRTLGEAEDAKSTMNRGAIVWVDLSDATPPEMGKRRSAVVVSNTVQNHVLDTLVAVPLSSQAPSFVRSDFA